MLIRVLLVFRRGYLVNGGLPGWKIFWNNVYKPITSASVSFVSEIIGSVSKQGDFLQVVRDQTVPPPGQEILKNNDAGIDRAQQIAGDAFEIREVEDDGLTVEAIGGTRYKLVNDKFFQLDGDGNFLSTNVPVQSGCHQTRISIIEAAIADGLMDQEDLNIKNELECAIHTVQRAFSYGMAVGFNNFQRYPSIGGLVSGITLIIVFALPMLLFSIMVIDALIKWTMIAVLTPVFAGCACFQSTGGMP